MLDQDDKRWITETLNTTMDKRFSEFEQRMDEKMDKRMDEKMDRRFAEFEKSFSKK